MSGVGNSSFDIPDTVLQLRVSGSYTGSGFGSNFIVWIGPRGATCAVLLSPGSVGCRLLVNEILGTLVGRPASYDATVPTGSGGTPTTNSISISNSTGVSWSVAEIR